jgi:hypothetical protein
MCGVRIFQIRNPHDELRFGRLTPENAENRRRQGGWAALVAGSADTQATPRTPASSPPSAGRSQIAAPLPASSSPPRTPLVEPDRIVPPLPPSPPLPLPRKMGYCCRIFTPAQPVYPTASLRGFSLRRLHPRNR